MSDETIKFPINEIAIIHDIAARPRNDLVDKMIERFGERPACAVCIALASLFCSSLTDDMDQQHDQAGILNELMERWASHPLPWN